MHCDLSGWVVASSYWLTTLTLVIYAATLVRSMRDIDRRRLRELGLVILAAVVAVAVLFALVPPAYRVLADETNLLATSLSLHWHRTLNNIVTMAPSSAGPPEIVYQAIATRPPLFPYLVAVLHDLFGYHAGFPFVVNFCVGVGTLATLFVLGRELVGRAYAALATVLLAACPLYAIVVSSAGYDALNHWLFLLVLLGVTRFEAAPSPARFARIVVVTALAAQARYESVLLVVPLAVYAVCRWRLLVAGRRSLALLLSPLLFLPAVIHRFALGIGGTEGGQPELRGRPVFAVQYLWPNFKRSLTLFFDVRCHNYPIAHAASFLAVVGLVLVGIGLVRGRIPRHKRAPLAFAAAGTLLFALVHLSFAMGDLTTAYNVRFATIDLGPLALLAAYALYRAIERLPRRASRVALVTVAAGFCALYLPVARRNELVGSLTLPREYAANLKTLERFEPARLVVVSDRPSLYAARGLASVDAGWVERNAARLRAESKAQRLDVVVIQHVDQDGRARPPLARTRLTTLSRYHSAPDGDVRVALLVFDEPTSPQARR